MQKVGKIASRDMLLYIAAGLLGALFLYELIMTLVLLKMRRHRVCMCNLVQANGIRRWAACSIAWLYVFFAVLNLVRIYDNYWQFLNYNTYILPFTFLIIFYIIEFFFTALQRCHCNCTHAHFDSPKEHHQEFIPTPTPEPKPEPEPEPVKKKEIIEAKDVETPTIIERPATPELKAPRPKRVAKPKVEEEPAPIVVAQEVIAQPIQSIPQFEAELPAEPAPKITKPRAPRTTTPKPRAAAAPKPRTATQKTADTRPHDAAYYAELAEKIEKQRLRAEQKTDRMDSHGQLESYSARTQSALAETAETAQVSKEIAARDKEEETAAREAELQRRMEILRQSVAPSTTRTTQRIEQRTVRYSDDVRVRGSKSVAELRREQDGLKMQYQTLQNKLDEIKYGKRSIPETPRSTSSVGVGYYSTPENFERTGERAYLPKISAGNKFDEEEVRSALLGLRQAIDDLQNQIDRREE